MANKPIELRIGDWSMDARSEVDDVDLKAFRYNKNFRLSAKRKICRSTGFAKAFSSDDYNNSDLHDQLLDKTGIDARAPITFAFEATSTRKTTKLIVGTNQALFAYNSGTRNYKILSDIYGTTDTHWRAAQLKDVVVFSNAYDALVYWNFDQGVTEADDQSVAPIPDLIEIGVTRAGVVVNWKGHVLLMNVTVDGSNRSNGIFWCNYENALDWIPGEASTAGSADIDYGETILAALPIANRLLVYTNKGIWEGVPDTEETFRFAKRYTPDNGENCLFFPRTLVSKGSEHVFAGEDGIYTYSLFMDKPTRPEWVHKASSLMFKAINQTNCSTHVAGYNTKLKELYFSYATGENTIPNETLVLNTEYPFAHIMDHGFSCFVPYTYRGQETLVRDFLRDNCICTDEEIASEFGDFVKEGLNVCGEVRLTEDGDVRYLEDGITPRLLEPEAEEAVTCEVTPTVIYTTVNRTETYGAESIEVEDWEEAEPSEGSLSDLLDGATLQSLCESEVRADECNSGKKFIAASSTDYCLKEFSEVYYREICVAFSGCGHYEQQGYQSILRGVIGSKWGAAEVLIKGMDVEASNVDQLVPSQFVLRVGNHSQAVDPNDDTCGIIWDEQDALDIDCLSGDTSSGHVTANTRPSEIYDWNLYYQGNYIFWELAVKNPDADPVDTGGECCLSKMRIDITPAARMY